MPIHPPTLPPSEILAALPSHAEGCYRVAPPRFIEGKNLAAIRPFAPKTVSIPLVDMMTKQLTCLVTIRRPKSLYSFTPLPMPLQVGQTISDYQILELLGKGGMGRVYRVRNVVSNRIEAMKVLLDDLASEPDLADRFMTEIRTLARLDHPNIAKLHTAVTVENQLLMVMELVEGSTLTARIKQGPVPLNDILGVSTQILSALAYAHSNGVIHRDVKPANVMLTPQGVVKLMDFGIAKSATDQNQTRTGITMGSMLYMSPEQVRGSTVDARSDIYSAGVTLYELATGKLPFDSDTTHAILDAQLNQTPRPPIESNPSLPPALNEIILMAMAKEPMRRFQTADAFRKALESLSARPAPAVNVPPPVVGSVATYSKNNRGLWMALGAMASICVLVAAAVAVPRFFKSHAASQPPQVQSTPPTLTPPAQPPAVVPASPPSNPVPPTDQAPPPSITPAPVSAPQRVTAPPNLRSTPHSEPAVAKPIVPSSPAALPPPEAAPQPKPPAQPVPSAEQLETASEDLMKLRSRADAVRGSLDHLRAQQAADGLNLNQTVTAGASRMENYLQAADRALQNSNLEAARKNLERADTEIAKLESFFGR